MTYDYILKIFKYIYSIIYLLGKEKYSIYTVKWDNY